MVRRVYRYSFNPGIRAVDVEAVLLLAFLAAEAIHGEARVRLEAAYFLAPDKGCCIISADTAVGKTINKLFVAFLRQGGDETAFTVEPLTTRSRTATAGR